MTTMRGNSRAEWNGAGSMEHIQTGCLQRIADATEAMAKNYTSLQNDKEYLERRAKYLSDHIDYLTRSNAALRGVITKMKKAAERGEA